MLLFVASSVGGSSDQPSTSRFLVDEGDSGAKTTEERLRRVEAKIDKLLSLVGEKKKEDENVDKELKDVDQALGDNTIGKKKENEKEEDKKEIVEGPWPIGLTIIIVIALCCLNKCVQEVDAFFRG